MTCAMCGKSAKLYFGICEPCQLERIEMDINYDLEKEQIAEDLRNGYDDRL